MHKRPFAFRLGSIAPCAPRRTLAVDPTMLTNRALARLLLTALLLIPVVTEPAAAADPIAEATVTFRIDYEDMGPMGAMLPKTERVFFRPGQMRVETGLNISLYGVVPDHQVALLAMPEHKLAFVIPTSRALADGETDELLLRYEDMNEERTIAGLPTFKVDGVDREDETNRISYWFTDRLDASYPATGAPERGFALDYLIFMNDGTAHKVATSIDTSTLDDQLFAIPEGYRRIDIESAREIPKYLGEIMGGDIQVVE